MHIYDADKARGLVFLPVSLDNPKEIKAQIVPFLKQKKMTGPSVVMADMDPEKVVEAIDKDWDGGTPRTYVIDRAGKVRKVITAEQSPVKPRELEATVKDLLTEKPAPAPPPTAHPKGFLGAN